MQDDNPVHIGRLPAALRWVFRQVRAMRPGRVCLIAFFLLVVLDVRVRKIESIPDLVFRNETRHQAATPYMLARMRAGTPAIAFLGDSVMQGLITTPPDRTAAVLIQNQLRANGHDVTAFNLSSMGAQMGDHYAVGVGAMRNGADAIVVSLHYKLFSSHPMFTSPLRYKQTAFYLRDEPELGEALGKLGVSPKEWLAIRVRGNLANIWGLYRYRGLLSQLVTGSYDNPLVQIEDRWAKRLGVVIESDPGRNILRALEARDRDRENLWMDMLKVHHDAEREVFGQMEINRYNDHVAMLVRLAKKAKKSHVPMLMYFTPQNRRLIDRENYFNWENFAYFQRKLAEAVEGTDVHVADMTDAVPAEHFTDSDHITRRGHEILAAELYPHVAALWKEAADR